MGSDTMNIIKTIIRQQSQKVFPVNLHSYYLVCVSYHREIKNRLFEYETLTRELSDRIRGFQSQDKSCIPPLLCKRIGETSNEYLERCYRKGGYKTL